MVAALGPTTRPPVRRKRHIDLEFVAERMYVPNFDLEDMDGFVRSICWPDGFDKYGEMIQPDAIVLVRGSVDKRGEDDLEPEDERWLCEWAKKEKNSDYLLDRKSVV